MNGTQCPLLKGANCMAEECGWFIEETGYCTMVYLHTIALELMELRPSKPKANTQSTEGTE